MQTLESQLFVITFALALLIIIVFLYKVMLRSLGGPDKKVKKQRREKRPEGPAQESAPARRPVVRREESVEEGGTHG